MQLDFLKVIWHEGGFFPPHAKPVLSIRLDTTWAEVPEYSMRYKSAEITIRWPRALRIRLDLAQYRTGGFLEPHTDITQEYVAQVNLILLLRKPQRGGELISEKFIYDGSRLKILRPNLHEHSLTKITEGERWVLNLKLAISTDSKEQVPF